MAVTRTEVGARLTAANDSVPLKCYIKEIRWTGIGAHGDSLVIQNAAGETVFDAKGFRSVSTDTPPDMCATFWPVECWDTPKVTTLSSGAVTLYFQ